MHPFEREVLRFVRRRKLILPGQKVCCAVSGGADSVALLLALLALRKTLRISVCACHMEHGIRGEESVRDMQFVQALCREKNVPLMVKRADVPSVAKKEHCGLETAARQVRRAFFHEAMKGFAAEVCALAHHRDDQAESVLLHLVRGSRSLVGIQPKNGPFIRPLLACSRKQVEGYLRDLGHSWCEDCTNQIADNPRNILRLQVIPTLETINPETGCAIARAAEYAARDEAYLQSLAEEELQMRMEDRALRVQDWDKLPEPVARRVLALFGEKMGAELSGTALEQLEELACGQSGKTAEVAGKSFRKEGNELRIPQEKTLWPEGEISVPGTSVIPGLGRFEAQVTDKPENPAGKDAYVRYFDAETLGNTAVCRVRRPGDRMHPFGAKGSRLLQDIFTDKKIPLSQREMWPLLENENGIFWVVGLCTGHEARVREETQRVVQISFFPETKA